MTLKSPNNKRSYAGCQKHPVSHFSDDPGDDGGLRNKFHAAAFDPGGGLNGHNHEFTTFRVKTAMEGSTHKEKVRKSVNIDIWGIMLFSAY